MRLLPQIQAVGLISPRLFPIDRSFHRRLLRRREKDTERMARSENNEAHGSGNVPATPAGAAAAGGGGAPAAGSGKQAAVPARGAEGQSVVRRLQSELMALMMGRDSGVSAFPEGDNIFHSGQVVLRLRRPHHPPLHPEPPRRAEQRLAAQHAGGGAMGKSGRVQEDGGEALQARVVEEGRSIGSVEMLLWLHEHRLCCGGACVSLT